MDTLVTLEEMMGSAPRAEHVAADRDVGTLDEIAGAGRRNAPTDPFYQWKLREYVTALVKAYGYRQDFRPRQAPYAVPYLPLPFAGEMASYFRTQADHFLGQSYPGNMKQPGLIKNRMAMAEGAVGLVRGGIVSIPNAASYEDAPSAVAAKAPEMFRADIPAGQPHPKVMTGPATWTVLDALQRLAIHFDSLTGAPSRIDIFVESVEEAGQETVEKAAEWLEGAGQFTLDTLAKVPDAARAAWNAPGDALKAGKEILTVAAVVGVAVLGLWAVSR